MAVVIQSSVKFGKKRVLLVGATNFIIIIFIFILESFVGNLPTLKLIFILSDELP